MYTAEQIALARELMCWACGFLSTVFAIAAGAVAGGWVGALSAAAAGFGTLAGVGTYSNRPTAPTAPKA